MTVPKHWKGVAFAAYNPSPEVRDFTRCETCVKKHKLSVGWWYDWSKGQSRVCNPAEGGCGATTVPYNSATFVPMSFAGENISDVVSSRPPGSYYLIFNEPEWMGGGTPIPAATAADLYFACYNQIKAEDSTAKIGGIGLLFIPENGQIAYLTAFLNQLKWKNENTGGWDAKFDFYAIHAYYALGPLQNHIAWLHGTLPGTYSPIVTSSTPVWITETSRLDASPGDNRTFMTALVSWLNSWGFDTGIVRRVAWFSTHSDYDGTNLFEDDLSTLTDLGEDWLAKEDNEMFTGFKSIGEHPTYEHAPYHNADVAVGTHPIDTSNYGCPAGVKACFVRLSAKWDAAGAGNGAYCKPKGQAWPFSVATQVRAHEASFYDDATGIVICDEYGDFDFVVQGATAKGVYLHICGYWE